MNFNNLLTWSVINDQLEVAKHVLANGANVQANDDEALCWASSNGHTEVVKLLQAHSCSKAS